MVPAEIMEVLPDLEILDVIPDEILEEHKIKIRCVQFNFSFRN